MNDFSAGSYSSAAQRLQNVLASPGWAEAPVVYLFLGNADLRLGRLRQAQDAYQAALRLEPDYARAQFGLAELQFQRACGGWQLSGSGRSRAGSYELRGAGHQLKRKR